MIRTHDFAFLVFTALACVGLYRIAEEARVTQAALRGTEASIAAERSKLEVLGAEWARVTQPARIHALAARHLHLADRPPVELSSLSALPAKNAPLAPPSEIRDAAAVAALPKPSTSTDVRLVALQPGM